MKPPENKKVFPELVSNPPNYMESFAKNIKAMEKYNGFSAEKLSEISNISLDTAKNLVSSKATDCKLSTAIKLSKIFGISIDELVGCGTMRPEMFKIIEVLRKLPKHEYNILMFYINRLEKINLNDTNDLPENINVLLPKCTNGALKWVEEWERLNIKKLDPDIRIKSFMALKVPCYHYMPVYSSGDILLLANDRQPINGEHCVIELNGYMYITRCVRTGGKYVLNSIINDKAKACSADLNRIIGYVSCVIPSDE